ncbi:unnamed protein product [Diplocarpon coronariae]
MLGKVDEYPLNSPPLLQIYFPFLGKGKAEKKRSPADYQLHLIAYQVLLFILPSPSHGRGYSNIISHNTSTACSTASNA